MENCNPLPNAGKSEIYEFPKVRVYAICNIKCQENSKIHRWLSENKDNEFSVAICEIFESFCSDRQKTVKYFLHRGERAEPRSS